MQEDTEVAEGALADLPLREAAKRVWDAGCVVEVTPPMDDPNGVMTALRAAIAKFSRGLRLSHVQAPERNLLCVYLAHEGELGFSPNSADIEKFVSDKLRPVSEDSKKSIRRLEQALMPERQAHQLRCGTLVIVGQAEPPQGSTGRGRRGAKMARIIAFDRNSLQLTLRLEDSTEVKVTITLEPKVGAKQIVQRSDVVQILDRLASPFSFEFPLTMGQDGKRSMLHAEDFVEQVQKSLEERQLALMTKMENAGLARDTCLSILRDVGLLAEEVPEHGTQLDAPSM